MFLSLWAAVTTFLVPRPLLLLLSFGMTAQLPMKSLFWLRTRQVQGNSPGLASPCWRPRAGAGKFLVPHCLPELTTLSLQPYRGASNWLAEAPGAMHERPKTEWSRGVVAASLLSKGAGVDLRVGVGIGT